MNATENDFEKFFLVAKAHDCDFAKCQRLAVQGYGKTLGEMSAEDLEDLGRSICFSSDLHFGRAGHSHPIEDEK